jgi:hypothetical protein
MPTHLRENVLVEHGDCRCLCLSNRLNQLSQSFGLRPNPLTCTLFHSLMQ